MQLTHYTDFSLRVLIYLALQQKGSLVTIDDVAQHFKIFKNHLTKIVHHLAQQGYVKTVRGKYGGICLAQSADRINIGKIIQTMENNIEIVNCDQPACPLNNQCELKCILNEAQNAFFSTLEKYTLADITKHPQQIKNLLSHSTSNSKNSF